MGLFKVVVVLYVLEGTLQGLSKMALVNAITFVVIK